MATKTKKPAKSGKPKKRVKQGHLAGMEPPSVPEIDAAAESFVEVRDERMSLGKTEKERKAILHALMKKNGMTSYEYDGKKVEIESKEKVRVRKAKEGEDGHDHEDDEAPDAE